MKLNESLIKKLGSGEIALLYDHMSIELLTQIIKEAFPSSLEKPVGTATYYYLGENCGWTSRPTLPDKRTVFKISDFMTVSEFDEDLIEKLRNGEISLMNDHSSVTDLNRVLKRAFPKDTLPTRTASYYCRHPSNHEMWTYAYKTILPSVPLRQFFNKSPMTNVDSRFPFQLGPVSQKELFNSVCKSWKEKLAAKWGEKYMLGQSVIVTHEEYIEARKAAEPKHHALLDEIFGPDNLIPDGTPCLVRSEHIHTWELRYADGKGKFYPEGKKSGTGCVWHEYMVLDMNNLPVNP